MFLHVDHLLREGEARADVLRAFMANVEKLESGCWIWRGQRDVYGKFRSRPAHVVSWALHQGPVGPHEMILHGCNIIDAAQKPLRGCVNPAHLRPGTAQDNSLDVYRQRVRRQYLKIPELSFETTVHGEALDRWCDLARVTGHTPQALFAAMAEWLVGPWAIEELNRLCGQDEPE